MVKFRTFHSITKQLEHILLYMFHCLLRKVFIIICFLFKALRFYISENNKQKKQELYLYKLFLNLCKKQQDVKSPASGKNLFNFSQYNILIGSGPYNLHFHSFFFSSRRKGFRRERRMSQKVISWPCDKCLPGEKQFEVLSSYISHHLMLKVTLSREGTYFPQYPHFTVERSYNSMSLN